MMAIRSAIYLAAVLSAFAQSPIETEIQRVQKSLAEKPITDRNFSGIAGEVTQRSKVAADAAAAGRLYFSLERLGQALDLLEGAHTAMDLAPTAGAGMPEFEKAWATSDKALATFEK